MVTLNPWPRLYRETARHPDNVRLLNELGAALTARNTCGGVHTKGRTSPVCDSRQEARHAPQR